MGRTTACTPRRRAPHGHTVFASWNGATQVVGWRVLGGSSAGALHPVANAARRGFETAIAVAGHYAIFEVQALGAGGDVVLRSSKPFS